MAITRSCHHGHRVPKGWQDRLYALGGDGSDTPAKEMTRLKKSRTAQNVAATRSATILFHALEVGAYGSAEKLGKDGKELNEMTRLLGPDKEKAKEKLLSWKQ